MKYGETVKGKFISRPNRFIGYAEIDGKTETVHIKNTGRCRELLLPGSEIVLEKSKNPCRKTQYDLVAVYKNGLGLVNIDSMAPNAVVAEWLKEKHYINNIHPEYRYGKSRIDFYFEKNNEKCLLEVKGCTLEIDGTGYFPDAPTERGVKHLNELAYATDAGMKCYLLFVIAMPKVKTVLPNINTHPEFGVALENAKARGVKVIFLPCVITEDEIKTDPNYEVDID